ncbi:MAG: lamin tail domain-containing protein, partial [Candidatus Hydrogenedentes bacterium]|nr:lamin tail domain-containing protein [Candidatus Hydrogenedentota bacterium]
MNPIKRFLISCLASTIFMFPAGGLVINEFMASNAAYMSDGDGDYEDWIELYNPGEETIYLAGYYLSDDEDNPFKWQFPAGNENVAPHLYYLIWTS